MTEKRFYTNGKYVMQHGEVWVVAGGEHSADVIATALNELIEERNELQFDYNMEVLTRQSIEKKNEELKRKVNGLKSELTIWKEDVNKHIQETNKLFEENKQLKKELESFEQVSFTDLCDGSRTILFMKKENGDSE